jgi:hypothetical protein
MTEYIVKTASARMPSSCWGRYGKIAVLEVEEDRDLDEPRIISERARGVVRVVEVWDRLHVGKTARCAFARALREAEALADKLNGSEAETMTGNRLHVALMR